ncbi:MAG TPA: efflux RND transporter periplasmic adaptor subunit [bacterium]|nr:efflux RND transporter periplasmic adaptor subunit [bacterium]HQI49483.1 efflux RND transporter periplasmic adaptor subunit [bacterium]HQJ64835.1 efflux RND transporter periplasmic adaptor subunit [bacterium]
MKKWIIALLVLVALLAVWFFTRSSKAVPAAAQSTLLQTDKVTRGDLRVEVSASGIVEPINKVEIKSKASGQIEEMKVEESDPVQRGDLIALLDQKDTQNSYNTAKADLQVAEATVAQKQSDFDRKSELYKKGLLSAADFDAAKLALVDAQAQVVRAKINLDNADIRLKETIVRSPIDGVVLTKDVEVGQIIASGISSVSGGTLIATVANMNRVYVKADVDEVDIGVIQPGMSATVVADAYPDKVFNGKVIRIAAQGKVVSNVTTFEVTIEVENPQSRLKAGMNTSVEILVADKKNVLLVPNEALMTRKELQQELGKLRLLTHPEEAGKRGAMAGGPMMAGGERPGAGRPPAAGSFATAGRPGAGTPGVAGERPQTPVGNDEEQDLRRGVLVKQGNEYGIKMVRTGVSNLDQTEVLAGLNENDEVVYTFYSRATEASAQMRQRMTAMESQRSGFRSN